MALGTFVQREQDTGHDPTMPAARTPHAASRLVTIAPVTRDVNDSPMSGLVLQTP